jgi:hypothetical protein
MDETNWNINLMVEQKIAQQTDFVIKNLNQIFVGNYEKRNAEEKADIDKIIFEYLFGLDHSILFYVRDAADIELNKDSLIFEGFSDEIRQQDINDLANATNYVSDFRNDEETSDKISDWFNDCWKKAGGDACQFTCYWMIEGDSDLYNLKTEEWES